MSKVIEGDKDKGKGIKIIVMFCIFVIWRISIGRLLLEMGGDRIEAEIVRLCIYRKVRKGFGR